ncbi:MAG: CBS domain-containing protein [Thermoplasmatales archaeon]|nr:CBS domain-containing protein [Thermoplasmatales archaeon]
MLVEEVMTRDIVRVDSNKTVYDACKLYSKLRVGSLVVMNKDITVGIVTERDAIEKVILQSKDPKKTKIKDIMSPNLITVHALSPLERAAQIMKESNIKKLPVILNNEIVGIVTETDLSRTIDVFSDAIDELIDFYSSSKNGIEKIIDDWGDLLVKLKGYKKLEDNKELHILKEEM